MDLLHKMNNRDRQLLGIICGVPFGAAVSSFSLASAASVLALSASSCCCTTAIES